MQKLTTTLFTVLILILFFKQTSQSTTCYQVCQTCQSSSPFTCKSCLTTQISTSISLYLFSCQNIALNNPLFLGLCIVIICLHLFMLAMGSGIYGLIYTQIQIVGLLMWVNLGQWSVGALQATNFGVLSKNSFVKTYGVQMIILLFGMSVFFFILIATSRTPHNPTAILIRRKRIIFPLRISCLAFNMLFFSSLTSASTIMSISRVDIFELFLTILGLVLSTVIFIGIFFICNFKVIKLDDPNYYPICQKMISTRWWVRNNLIFQYICSVVILTSFIIGFQQPSTSIIPILLFQSIYTIYIFLFISFTKIRYKIILTLSNIIFFTILYTISGLISTWTNQINFNNYKVAYIILVICLCLLFIVANFVEIIVQRFKIRRLLRSIKNRFILCQMIEKEVELNKYDSTGRKQKVVQFQDNQLFGQDLSQIRQRLATSRIQTIN